MRNALFAFLLCSLMSVCTGCFLPAALQAPLAGRATKIRLLNSTADKFHKGVYWNDRTMSAEFVSSEAYGTYERKMLEGVGKVIAVKTTSVELAPEDDSVGYVEVVINFYDQRTYVVKSKKRREVWEFSRVAGGWLFKDVLFSTDVDNTDDPLGIGRGIE